MGDERFAEGPALAAGLARLLAARRFAGIFGLDLGLALPITHHSSLITVHESSPTSHEQFVEFCEGDLMPGRPAMVALAGAFGRLHLAQQAVHLGNRQL